jgi:hypothetical protein
MKLVGFEPTTSAHYMIIGVAFRFRTNILIFGTTYRQENSLLFQLLQMQPLRKSQNRQDIGMTSQYTSQLQQELN